MKDKVEVILRNLFPSSVIDSNFSRINCDDWDSINHLNLMFELESAFEINIEPEKMMKISDVKSVLDMLENKLNK